MDTWRYALVEWAHTDERALDLTRTKLTSLLGEGAYCRAGVIVAGRLERTNRPEEEPLADPFRTPRPSSDLSNLGLSRWTTVTASVSSPAVHAGVLSGRPFVEVAQVHVSRGNPPGIFDPALRYGTSRLWMLTAGVRLRAGMMHDRMGRYGVAVPGMPAGTAERGPESESMSGMSMNHSSVEGRCAM